MLFLRCLKEGFRIAARHKRLVLVLWLAPLVPAAALAAMAAANLVPALGPSLFADRALHGDGFLVWSEFRSSPLDALDPILRSGVVVMLLLSLAVQVVLTSGVIEVVLEHRERHPFVLGVRRNFLRFARTTILLTVGTALAAAAAAAVVRGFFKLAEAQADGRLDLAGIAAAGVVFFLLWAPQALAADLSRIAAARYDQRSMTRGYLRALWVVVRRPGFFMPLAGAFLILPAALHLAYYLLRSPWTPATAAALVGLLLAQQGLMVARSALKLGFRGAEVAAFRRLGEPPFCRSRTRREREQPVIEGGGVPVSGSVPDPVPVAEA